MDLSTYIVDLLRKHAEDRAVHAGEKPPQTRAAILPPGAARQAGEKVEGRRAQIEQALADAGA